jgi:O-acetyl-ADP-ribose deacetylase (regulator of RNase III)
MIKISQDSLFNVDAQALVNTVNCVGAMGAGIALEFRLRYPQLFLAYETDVKNGDVQLGKVNYYQFNDLIIINFPTKYDFKYPSKLEWISSGLDHFIQTYSHFKITKIAFPKLGSNNGGLEWNSVKEVMITKLAKLPIEIIICEDTNPAKGFELKMLNALKNINLTQLALRPDKYRVLEFKLFKINRFFELIGEGLGIDTYEKIYGFISSKISQGDFLDGNYFNEDFKAKIREYFYNQNWKNFLHLTEVQVRSAMDYISFSKKNGFSFYEFITLKTLSKISQHCLSNFDHVSLL